MSTETNNTEQTSQQATSTAQEPQQTTEGTTPPEGTEQEQEGQQDGQQEDGKPVPEAKKYRLRAQAAEAERDTLQTRLTAMLRIEATRIIETAAHKLHKPEDLFEIGGVKLEDLINDDGMIDQDKINTAITDLHNTRGYLFQQPNNAGNDALRRGAGERERIPAAPSWKNALKR